VFNNLLGSLSSHALCCAFQRKHFLLDSIATYFSSFSWQTQACCYGCHPSSLTRRSESRIAAELGVSALQSTIPSNPKAGVENPTAKPMMVSQPSSQNYHSYHPFWFLLLVILSKNTQLVADCTQQHCGVHGCKAYGVSPGSQPGNGMSTAVLAWRSQHAVTVAHVLMA